MFEIHLFQAIARASERAAGPYLPGDRHAMLVFLRQTVGTDHDWAAAESEVVDAGWIDVSLDRAGTVAAENLNGKSESFMNAYQSATSGRCGLIVYADPVPEDEE